MTDQSRPSLWKRPGTRLSWWAIGFGIASLVMLLINVAVAAITKHPAWPFLVYFMLLCALTAGAIGIIAIILKHERSWLVWLTILSGFWSLSFLLNSPVLLLLIILIIIAVVVGVRAKTFEFKHYFMFGIPSGFLGVILKVWSWNQTSFLNSFAKWGILVWWWFIPIIVLVSAWIGAWAQKIRLSTDYWLLYSQSSSVSRCAFWVLYMRFLYRDRKTPLVFSQ